MIYPEDTPLFDVPEADYRAADGINVSALKHMRLSPAHFKFAKEEAEPDKVNSNLIIGTLVHRARLEPHRLCYAVRPETYPATKTAKGVKDGTIQVGDPVPWNGNATWCKDWLARQTLPVVTPDEEQQILRCADALGQCDLLNEACARGKTEVTMFKRHKRTGLLLKGRADIVFTDDDGMTWIIDLKTVPEGGACEDAFSRKIADFNYHQQAAFYCDLFDTPRFLFIAVEKQGYPGVGIYEVAPEDLEIGRRTNEALLEQLSRAIKSDTWEGYSPTPRQISLPGWARKRDSKDIT